MDTALSLDLPFQGDKGAPLPVKRPAGRQGLKDASVSDPEAIRARIVEEDLNLWCAGLKRGLRNDQRWAFRLFAECAKLVHVQPQVAIALFQSVGVRDETELKRIVSAYQEATSAPPAQAADAAARVLGAYVREHPDERKALMERVFGLTEASE